MEYHLLSDPLLLKLLAVDDEGAFKEIYQRYWKRLFETARQKVKLEEEAEELLQDVFLSIWEKRASLQIDNLGGYLFNALKFRIIDSYRSQASANRYREFAQTRTIMSEQTPEDESDFNEIIKIFEEALYDLPAKTASIFRMSRLEFRTAREISQTLNIPERTVEYHITQSLRLMRERLRDFLPISLIFYIL